MSEPPGCSQWKWFPCDTCNRYNTTPKAICHTCWKRLYINFSSSSIDFPMFRKFHIDHGPHSGLYHRLFGLRRRMSRNNRILSDACWRSPSVRPKRWALPLSWRTCLVSSLFSEHMTSNTSSLDDRIESKLSRRSMLISFSNTVTHFWNSCEKLMGWTEAWNSNSTSAGSVKSFICEFAQSSAWRLIASWSRSTLTSRSSPGCPWCERSGLESHSRSHTSSDACCGDWPACWSFVPVDPSHDCWAFLPLTHCPTRSDWDRETPSQGSWSWMRSFCFHWDSSCPGLDNSRFRHPVASPRRSGTSGVQACCSWCKWTRTTRPNGCPERPSDSSDLDICLRSPQSVGSSRTTASCERLRGFVHPPRGWLSVHELSFSGLGWTCWDTPLKWERSQFTWGSANLGLDMFTGHFESNAPLDGWDSSGLVLEMFWSNALVVLESTDRRQCSFFNGTWEEMSVLTLAWNWASITRPSWVWFPVSHSSLISNIIKLRGEFPTGRARFSTLLHSWFCSTWITAPICFRKLADNKKGAFPSTIATSNHMPCNGKSRACCELRVWWLPKRKTKLQLVRRIWDRMCVGTPLRISFTCLLPTTVREAPKSTMPTVPEDAKQATSIRLSCEISSCCKWFSCFGTWVGTLDTFGLDTAVTADLRKESLVVVSRCLSLDPKRAAQNFDMFLPRLILFTPLCPKLSTTCTWHSWKLGLACGSVALMVGWSITGTSITVASTGSTMANDVGTTVEEELPLVADALFGHSAFQCPFWLHSRQWLLAILCARLEPFPLPGPLPFHAPFFPKPFFTGQKPRTLTRSLRRRLASWYVLKKAAKSWSPWTTSATASSNWRIMLASSSLSAAKASMASSSHASSCP